MLLLKFKYPIEICLIFLIVFSEILKLFLCIAVIYNITLKHIIGFLYCQIKLLLNFLFNIEFHCKYNLSETKFSDTSVTQWNNKIKYSSKFMGICYRAAQRL